MSHSRKDNPGQLELGIDLAAEDANDGSSSSAASKPALRLIRGAGEKRPLRIDSRDAVVRVLIEAGADLLLRKISSERAEEIRQRVERIMSLFDRVDGAPRLLPSLKQRLDELEGLMRETRGLEAGKGR